MKFSDFRDYVVISYERASKEEKGGFVENLAARMYHIRVCGDDYIENKTNLIRYKNNPSLYRREIFKANLNMINDINNASDEMDYINKNSVLQIKRGVFEEKASPEETFLKNFTDYRDILQEYVESRKYLDFYTRESDRSFILSLIPADILREKAKTFEDLLLFAEQMKSLENTAGDKDLKKDNPNIDNPDIDDR